MLAGELQPPLYFPLAHLFVSSVHSTELEIEIAETLAVDSCGFPSAAVVSDVPQANGRVGDDRNTAQSNAVAEGIVLCQIPVVLSWLHFDSRSSGNSSNHRLKERPRRPIRVFVAHRQ